MARFLVIALAALALVLVAQANLAAALDDDLIRCKVCEKAIADVWHDGVALRAHCRTEMADPRCDYMNLHKFGIEEMVHKVCDKLPTTHQAMVEEGFDLVAKQDPDHPEHVAAAIRDSCYKWIHDEHGLEKVGLYMFANLDSGKATETILHSLQFKFCSAACNPKNKGSRHRQSASYRMPSQSQSSADL
jgi:hypothetical protein